MNDRYKHKKALYLYLGIAALVAVLNAAAWASREFCDFYIAYIFPVWVNTYGRVTGIFPFSVGEIMLGLGVLVILAAALLGVAALAVWLARRTRDRKFWRFIKGYFLTFAWIFLIVCLVMTLNCFILYHASTFSAKYFGEDSGEYGLEELVQVRNMVVEKCNALSLEMERDAEGTILYDGDIGDKAVESMKALGITYPQLDGFYPHPKPLYTSDFFCQQYMCGYYFPFSMEANYNDVMYIMNKPSTMCHELAHLRGYIFEDEANFISFLACVQSEDKMFQYSGYLSVLNYLDNDFYAAVGKDRERYLEQPVISKQVMKDNVFVTKEEWDRINKKALIDTETVDKVSDVLVDTTLKANGVSDGMVSYNRVVRLLLQYFNSRKE